MLNIKPFFYFILIGSILSVYGQTITFDFVNYDDAEWIYQNANLNLGFSWAGIKWAFSAVIAGTWNPIPALSFLLEYRLFGLNPGMYHVTNVWLHVLNCFLLLKVAINYGMQFFASMLLTLIFALHPTNAETVAWISERKGVLSGVFFFLSLLAYKKYCEKTSLKRYLGVYFLFVLGLLTKPILITLPFIFLLLDYWPLKRLSSVRSLKLKTVADCLPIFEKIPLFVICLLDAIIVYQFQEDAGGVVSVESSSILNRIENVFINYVFYLKLFVFPVSLTPSYLHRGSSSALQVSLCLAILCFISYLVYRKPSRSVYFLGWHAFLIALIPIVGFVQIGHISVADRYLYLPKIFLILMLTFLLVRLRKLVSAKQSAAICGAILIGMGFVTFKQVRHWKDGVSLFSHVVYIQPENWVAHNNLGVALAVTQQDYDRAETHFLEALRLNPDYPSPRTNLLQIINTNLQKGKKAASPVN